MEHLMISEDTITGSEKHISSYVFQVLFFSELCGGIDISNFYPPPPSKKLLSGGYIFIFWNKEKRG
jgi:hypothetical protein